MGKNKITNKQKNTSDLVIVDKGIMGSKNILDQLIEIEILTEQLKGFSKFPIKLLSYYLIGYLTDLLVPTASILANISFIHELEKQIIIEAEHSSPTVNTAVNIAILIGVYAALGLGYTKFSSKIVNQLSNWQIYTTLSKEELESLKEKHKDSLIKEGTEELNKVIELLKNNLKNQEIIDAVTYTVSHFGWMFFSYLKPIYLQPALIANQLKFSFSHVSNIIALDNKGKEKARVELIETELKNLNQKFSIKNPWNKYKSNDSLSVYYVMNFSGKHKLCVNDEYHKYFAVDISKLLEQAFKFANLTVSHKQINEQFILYINSQQTDVKNKFIVATRTFNEFLIKQNSVYKLENYYKDIFKNEKFSHIKYDLSLSDKGNINVSFELKFYYVSDDFLGFLKNKLSENQTDIEVSVKHKSIWIYGLQGFSPEQISDIKQAIDTYKIKQKENEKSKNTENDKLPASNNNSNQSSWWARDYGQKIVKYASTLFHFSPAASNLNNKNTSLVINWFSGLITTEQTEKVFPFSRNSSNQNQYLFYDNDYLQTQFDEFKVPQEQRKQFFKAASDPKFGEQSNCLKPLAEGIPGKHEVNRVTEKVLFTHEIKIRGPKDLRILVYQKNDPVSGAKLFMAVHVTYSLHDSYAYKVKHIKAQPYNPSVSTDVKLIK